MKIQTHRFSVSVDCAMPQTAGGVYEDHGFLILPQRYRETGEATRLVINCHGAGGTVTTDDSQTEHTTTTQYLIANGYAVMDVNGLPAEYAEQNGIDLRNNVGSPIAVRSYVAAYRYCMERFNLKSEVFVHGGSMGGISSTNLVLCGQIPVIAHSALCPVLDTYNEIFLRPWADGLPKTALGKIYGFSADENGDFVYDENKVAGYNPVQTVKSRVYPVPAAFWHCEDDPVVSCDVTRAFVRQVNENGGQARLTTFPQGGHEPQLVGEPLETPSGNDTFNGEKIPVREAVEGVYRWIQSFE